MNNDVAYLKQNYPHLYEVEMVLNKIKESSYQGNVFIDMRCIGGTVDRFTVSWNEQKILKKGEDHLG